MLLILAGLPSIIFPNLCNADEPRPRVIVSIVPLKYFVQKIAEDKVTVSVMVPPGADPHSYEPKPKELKELSGASMYVKLGMPLEFELSWLDKLLALNPRMAVCDSSKEVQLLKAGRLEGESSKGIDPHIWVSLKNDVIIAGNIKNSFVEMDPSNKEIYERNFLELKKELENLNSSIQGRLMPFRGHSFIVIHSAWKYFARDYALSEIPIEAGGKEPSAKDLELIIKKAEKENIKIVFAAPEFSKKAAISVAREIGAKVEVIDHLSEDLPREIKKMAELISQSYGK